MVLSTEINQQYYILHNTNFLSWHLLSTIGDDSDTENSDC